MKRSMRWLWTIIFGTAFLCTAALAEVKLPAIIGDSMVLQQKSKVPIWGWADPGEKVQVHASWMRKAVKAKTGADGRWQVTLKTPAAGGPYRIEIQGSNKITLKNVLIGEVWLCSGQSNMEFPMRKTRNAEAEIAAATDPQLRLFTVPRRRAAQPQADCQGAWAETDSETVRNFSAVAYFFGRRLRKALDVPIGLIHSAWGGTKAEAWTSRNGLLQIDYFKAYLDSLQHLQPQLPQITRNSPSVLFNGMIAPLIPFRLRGVIWYQGESNRLQPGLYRELLPALIRDWRAHWRSGKFPFYYVQISPYDYREPYAAALLREAQLQTLAVANTGMVVTTDIGNVRDIHPKNKQEVGRRLALWALAKTYGQDEIVYSGPIYRKMSVQGRRIRLFFKHTGEGLATRGDTLTDFVIAGKDRRFRPAAARIDGETVLVSHPDIPRPVAVRFGWSNTAEPNLFNKAGLPASPFRTDAWPEKVQRAKAVSIIPRPAKLRLLEGPVHFDAATRICLDSDAAVVQGIAGQLAAKLQRATGWPVPIEQGTPPTAPGVSITLRLRADSTLGAEGYRFFARDDSVVIAAAEPAGLFYGVQTLYQLLPPEIEAAAPQPEVSWRIPGIQITDRPRFPWRGMHLDVARHFMPVDFVKKYIDLIAYHKMNTFHWHLTDDQGWRIEIKKYPKLTEIGSSRRESMGDGTPHGGFYTQEQIRDLVDYARKRFVTIVPEIELPGHAQAALAAYPELSCTGGPFEVSTKWGVHKEVFCAGNEQTFTFLQDVLTEVMALFPGEVIHIGGDEVPKDRWQACSKCQQRIKDEGLQDEHELQSYFIRRIEAFLNARGRRIIGWDEILEGGLAPNAAVMSWRGMDGGIAAAKAGHEVVMTPTWHCYFDYYQAKFDEPKAIGGYLPLRKVYEFEPLPDDIPADQQHFILGGQGNVWTEYIATPEYAEYMAVPRMSALAEVVWSPRSSRDFENFQRRMLSHYDRLVLKNVHFRAPRPRGLPAKSFVTGKRMVQLDYPQHAALRYTLDGTDPGPDARLYKKPIQIKGGKTLKVRAFFRDGWQSRVWTSQFIRVKPENGVHFRYFEGEWTALPDFSALAPQKSGRVYEITLAALEHRDDHFAVEFEGYFTIDQAGEYAFFLGSDDGSRLFIDGKALAENDGLHEIREVEGRIRLQRGRHAIRVQYFQGTGWSRLQLFYQPPNGAKQPLLPEMLFWQK